MSRQLNLASSPGGIELSLGRMGWRKELSEIGGYADQGSSARMSGTPTCLTLADYLALAIPVPLRIACAMPGEPASGVKLLSSLHACPQTTGPEVPRGVVQRASRIGIPVK